VSALRWSLIEASAGKIGSPVDKMLLMCFHYDPSTGRYNFAVMTAVRTLGVATFVAMTTYMFVMFRRDRRRSLAASPGV
jgi:protein SCO1/2